MARFKDLLRGRRLRFSGNRETWVFVLLLLLSAALWLLITLNETYEREFVVPVQLTNVPLNTVITTDPPNEIRIVLKDKGSTLLTYKLKPVEINFSTYSSHSGYVNIPLSDLRKQIAAQIATASTQIVSIKPDTVDFFYNKGLKKQLPVRLQGKIHTAEHYHLLYHRLFPESVMVYASQHVFDTLTAIYTEPIALNDLDKRMQLRVRLAKTRGAKITPSEAVLRLYIDQMTEKKVLVPVHGVNFPATKTLRTFPQNVTITFQVSKSLYKNIDENNFVLAVNYEELLQNHSKKCHLSLKTTPEGTSHVRIVPQDIDFLIEDIHGID